MDHLKKSKQINFSKPNWQEHPIQGLDKLSLSKFLGEKMWKYEEQEKVQPILNKNKNKYK